MYKYSKYNKDYLRFNNLFVENNSSNKIKRLLIFICLVMLVGIFILLIYFTYINWFDKNSSLGGYEGKSEEQIQADLNAQVNEGEMNVSIANTIKFPNGSLNEGIAHIENIAANHLDQKVSIYMQGSNELLYESGAIEPNHCINTIKLNKNLDPGIYKAIVIFKGFDVNTRIEKGELSAQINIQVY